MIRSAASKVMWVGRATVFLVGLAVIIALTVGVVSKATAHTGSAGLFHLNHNNPVTALSKLTGNLAGAVLKVDNNGAGPALSLEVGSGKAPMTVSVGAAKVANLDADKVDGEEASSFADANHAHSGRAITSGQVEADFIEDGTGSNLNADQLDSKDISELPGSVVQMATISGSTSDAGTMSNTLTFVSPTVTVTTTSTQRLVGVVSASLKAETSAVGFNYGLCYRAAGTSNAPLLFYRGTDTVQGTATTTPQLWTAAQSWVPGLAGTWDVGFCAQNNSDQFQSLKGDGDASGWIQVVNPTP